MSASRVSVIVPTYQDADLLRLAIPALRASQESLEIIVVNNDPSRDVARIALPLCPDVKIIEMGYPSGFGCAVNAGIAHGASEFVLILNTDVFVSPTYVREMLDLFARCPRAGCAGGKLYRYDLATGARTDIIDTAGVRLGKNRRTMARGEGQPDHGQLDVEDEVFGVDSAGMFVRRSALESIKIGDEYFDSSFFLHKEDTDLCWRLRLAGWEIWYVPTATGAHARTTRGLGERSYLSALREFHANTVEKSTLVQIHAMKNQWLMMVKNEDLSSWLLDSPFIVAREATVIGHNLIFAPRSLRAVREFLRLLGATLKKRSAIKNRQAISPASMRRWLGRA